METKTKITVAEAIKTGKRKAYWPALAIFLGGLSLFFPLSLYVNLHPGLCFGFAFLAGAIASWAWWGYHIVAWRFWAVAHVEDLDKLGLRALENDLIHNGLHEIGKLEIASADTRTRYKQWYQKYQKNTKEEEIADPQLPAQIVLTYSWMSQISAFLIVSISLFLAFTALVTTDKDPIKMLLFSLAMLGWGGYDLIRFSRKRALHPHALKITDQWIQFKQEPHVGWEKISKAITIKVGHKYPRIYIEIYSDSGFKSWDVTELNISQDKLDHYLDVFRTRAKNQYDYPIT